MRILNTIASMGINSGGPAFSTFMTVKSLREIGIEAEILVPSLVSEDDHMISNEGFIKEVKCNINNSFAFSDIYGKSIKNLVGNYDVLHAHGVWLYPTYITAKVAVGNNKPYIITPRGMLYPQALNVKKFRKSIFLKLFQLRDINNAACVHATCIQEMEYLRELGVKAPIAVIPNPIDLDSSIELVKHDGMFRLGYMGRLHPRKNVELLIRAWAQLKHLTNNAELVIIGGGDNDYEKFLKEEAERFDLKNVVFKGFLRGKEKDDVLMSLSILAMPSDFENLGNVILEALIRGIPCIASLGSPWEELNTYSCGWWLDTTEETLVDVIQEALSLNSEDLKCMGANGRQLIVDKYATQQIANKMAELYQWILDKKEKPQFVYNYE